MDRCRSTLLWIAVHPAHFLAMTGIFNCTCVVKPPGHGNVFGSVFRLRHFRPRAPTT
ncbi:hypothetical protein PR001_g311 [Phytophthora rubi]|uniref:Uncharacterized protein n=1 Tax=Phytophthora rubi TaxID=129364 RepID=A0A6A3NXB7_9STRA|nr:hypothetical protein PR002_g869 [Phytophthora rubi]KAE9052633.1 hypothetical protein PR001_g311 [Phytophthora rubi]